MEQLGALTKVNQPKLRMLGHQKQHLCTSESAEQEMQETLETKNLRNLARVRIEQE